MLGLLPGRVTYVIDRQGVVRQVFNSMTNISQHVTDALEMVRQLQAEQRACRPAPGWSGPPAPAGHQASAARAASLRNRPTMSLWTASGGCAPSTVNIHSRPA